MTTITGSLTVTLKDEGREDIYDVSYEASAHCVYRPARISGPPEDCHPDESELNDLEVTITLVDDEQGNAVDKTAPLWAALDNALIRALIEEQVWEAFMEDRS